MIRRKSKSIFLSAVLGLATLFGVGHSAFIVKGDASKDGLTITEGDAAVCYIKYSETSKTYYTSIEKALEVAKADPAQNSIYVIPGLDRVIRRSCEIAVGDVLYLPFEGETYENREGTGAQNTFADMDEARVKANRTSLVTVMPGVNISVYGTLTIGGVMDVPSLGLSGHTSGKYAEMLFKAGSASMSPASMYLYSGGTLDLIGGYIKKDVKGPDAYGPKVIANSGSNINIPFVIYDYQGGNTTGGIFASGHTFGVTDLGKTVSVDGYVCPFRVFDTPNLQIITDIYTGATVTGYLSLYTGKKEILGMTIEASYNLATTTLIGSNGSLLSISSGFARFKYEGIDNCLYTPFMWNKAQTSIEIYGTLTHQALTAELNAQIAKIAINTSQVLFPISFRYAVVVKNTGILNLPNPIKFMNGASLTVDKGGRVNVSSNLIFYTQGWTDHKPGNKYQVGGAAETTGIASFVNNGVVALNSTAKVAGKIDSEIEGSTLIVETDQQNVSSIECSGDGDISVLPPGYKFSAIEEITVSENLSIKDYAPNSNLSYVNAIPKGTYYSKANGFDDYGHYSHTIHYVDALLNSSLNVSDYAFSNSNRRYVSPFSRFSLTTPSFRKINSSAPDLHFGGFYLDSSFTVQITEFSFDAVADYLSGTGLTIYAKWRDTLGITVRYLDRNGTVHSEEHKDFSTAEIAFPSYPILRLETDKDANGVNEVVNVLTWGVARWEIVSAGTFADGGKTTSNTTSTTIVANEGDVVDLRPIDDVIATKAYYLLGWQNGSRPDVGDGDAYCTVLAALNVNDFSKETEIKINQSTAFAYVPAGIEVALTAKGYYRVWPPKQITVTLTAIDVNVSAIAQFGTDEQKFSMPAKAVYLTATHD
ncbi:MAG: hypothetical protein ACI32C_02680 [Candidatus Enteromonas sp.]